MNQNEVMALLLQNLGYVAVCCVAIWGTGWLVYERFVARHYALGEELFAKQNMSAAVEITAFAALQFLLAANALSGEALATSYMRDLEAVALTILISNLLFFSFRAVASRFVKKRFTHQLDSHGEVVEYNNEIFVQQNTASALFSVSFMILTYAMIRQEDFLDMNDYRIESFFNMAGVFGIGILLFLIYRWIFVPRGHGLLRELFIDNNPAIGLSLCGFLYANLEVQAFLMEGFQEGEHLFRTSYHIWVDFGIVLLFLIVSRFLFVAVISRMCKVSFQKELVVEDNPVTGLLDAVLFVSMARLLTLLMAF